MLIFQLRVIFATFSQHDRNVCRLLFVVRRSSFVPMSMAVLSTYNRFRTIFGPFSDGFGLFRILFGRFRTVFRRFRMVSDCFGRFLDRFGRFRIVFEPFRIAFGPFLDRFRIVSDRFRRRWCAFGPFSDDSTQNLKFKISIGQGWGGTARTDGTARTGPSPGQLKFENFKF